MPVFNLSDEYIDVPGIRLQRVVDEFSNRCCDAAITGVAGRENEVLRGDDRHRFLNEESHVRGLRRSDVGPRTLRERRCFADVD